MPSFVDGAAVVNKKLAGFEETFAAYMDARLDDEVKALQQCAADLAPVDTGEARDAILSPDAIKRQPRRGSTLARWTFGIAMSRAQASKTYYLFWREFGSKGYEIGDQRSAGVDKHGRKRQQRIKRRVPARPATPFFRPSVTEFMVRLRQSRALARVYAAAITAAGLNGKSR